MAIAEKILEIAQSQIGTKESPAKSDNVKYNTAYYGREVSDGKHTPGAPCSSGGCSGRPGPLTCTMAAERPPTAPR